MNILFFGSFQHYSTKIAQALLDDPNITLMGIVTTPPRPAGRDRNLKKTHTHEWAENLSSSGGTKLPVFTPDKHDRQDLAMIESTLDPLYESNDPAKKRIDFLVVAGYSEKLTPIFLKYPKHAPLNLHPSLLPAYRGVRPAEFALLFDEIETGATVIIMSEKFDTGPIIDQQKLKIDNKDTREILYQKLYKLEIKIILEAVKNWENVHKFSRNQPIESTTPYARKLTKEDGFIDWQTLTEAMHAQEIAIPMHLHKSFQLPTTVESIERTHRALYNYPGMWTNTQTSKGPKRLKLLELSIFHPKGERPRLHLDKVQLEGKMPSSFNQIKTILNT